MPYLLEKLPYGLRRRLRELATPAEAYAFQFAAPNYCGFQPIQKVAPKDYVMFQMSYDSKLRIRDDGLSIPLESVPFFQSSRYLEIESFKLAHSPQLILERPALSPQIVHFTNCIIGSTFIQTLVSRMEEQVWHVGFHNCDILEKNVAKLFCNANAFKSLKFITFTHSKTSIASWIDGFWKAKSSTLKEFKIVGASVSIFEINKKKFLKFYKAQHYTFQMDITMSNRIMKTEEQWNRLFGRRFKCMPEKPRNSQKYVCVHRGMVDRYYYLRKRIYDYDDDDVILQSTYI